MTRLFALSMVLWSGLSCAQSLIIDDDIDRHARAWIADIDAGNPGAAWDKSSNQLRDTLPRADWEKAVKPLQALGNIKSRSLSSVTFTLKMPGMPNGNYAVVSYHGSFTAKEEAIETVVLRHETDGRWQGVGYQVR